jgi:hypothetical protein
MAESSGPHGKGPYPDRKVIEDTKQRLYRIIEIIPDEPKLYRIVEVSPEELEGMQLGPDEGEVPNPRDHYDADSQGHHGHSHGGTGGDHDIDHSSGGGFHFHSHPV